MKTMQEPKLHFQKEQFKILFTYKSVRYHSAVETRLIPGVGMPDAIYFIKTEPCLKLKSEAVEGFIMKKRQQKWEGFSSVNIPGDLIELVGNLLDGHK